MKKYIQIFIVLLVSLLFNYFSFGQEVPIPMCSAGEPVTDVMWDVDGDCFRNEVIFTYQEYQELSEGSDDILGVPIDEIGNPDFDQTSNDNAIDLLAGAFGGDMTLEDLYDCLDIGCSPHIGNLQEQISMLSNLLNEEIDVQELYNSLADDEDFDEYSDQEMQDSLAYFEGEFDDVSAIGQNISEALDNLDINAILADAFGGNPGDCEDAWMGMLGDDNPFAPIGEDGGGDFLKNEIKESITELLSAALMMDSDMGSDPNWFLGEIEGLGMSGPSEMMPSPSSMSTIESIQGGVDLYNGTGSFGMALDNIASKDVAVPIAVNGTPGGLKVNDQEGLLGSNMDISAGGKITRVVKGLPDDFCGTIEGHGYGYKRGVKLVVELADIKVGIDMKVKNRFVRKLLCKIVSILLEEILNLPNGTAPGCGDSFANALDQIINDEGADPEEITLISEILDAFDLGEASDFITKPHELFPPQDVGPNVRISSDWKATNFNYLNLNVDVEIPMGSNLVIVIGTTIRTGLKITDVPSKVNINKECLGYNYLMNSDAMDEFDLSTVDVNDFLNLSDKETLKILNKKHATKKRDDHDFFSPRAFSFLDMFNELANLFNVSVGDPFPRYESQQIDLEPDEYYYNFGGYSGKFFFKPNGEIVLVPYQDFLIEVDYADNAHYPCATESLEYFKFTTPEGIQYTFDAKTLSQYNNYTLPTSLKYPEHGVDWQYFSDPTIGKVEYPFFKGVMGLPLALEVKKDYLTNYHVEEGPTYTSAWHATSIESLISKERIDLEYEEREITYNASKNWTHTFPNFGKEGGRFVTDPNDDLNSHAIPKEWKNGFADLTYSMSEVKVTENYIKTINNNRDKVATFYYEEPNLSMPGSELCTRIDISKNGSFYKGWKFNYTTPDYTEVNIDCDATTSTTEDGQGPAYAETNEYFLDIDVGPKDDNDRFVFYFPIVLQVFCLEFYVPIPLRWDIDDNHQSEYYFANKATELGSILHIKDYLGILDGDEGDRYQAEFVRNFLYRVDEIDAGFTDIPITTFDYFGDLSMLPKRHSVHQDIWGYYRNSLTLNPFIKQEYSPITNSDPPVFNSDHFGFGNPYGGGAFDQGRKWKSNLDHATIGQLERVTTETGAFLAYDYDLHQYPANNPLGLEEDDGGGLRIHSFSKGSDTGPTQTITYEYTEPTVVNYPIFTDQHYLDTYYKNKEERVKTSWTPLNQWQLNKGGFVGYSRVKEVFPLNGYVSHRFTSPNMSSEGYEPLPPYMENLHVKYNRILKFLNGNYKELEQEPLDYHPTFAPLISKDWRYGLEIDEAVIDEDGNFIEGVRNIYEFESMGGGNGSFKYPVTNMFQYLHYGSPNELKLDAMLYQLVDGLTECPQNLVMHAIRFIFKAVVTEHPYRFIEKDFPIAMMEIESEKIELKLSYKEYGIADNISWAETVYTYNDSEERKISKVDHTFSNNQSSSTEYLYADNFNSAYPMMDNAVLQELNLRNYEQPVLQLNKLNGNDIDNIVSGSATDFYIDGDDLILPQTIWNIKEGAFVLTGKFDTYDDGMPTSYSLAKYGTSSDPTAYDFFPPIIMIWNPSLQMTSRSMTGGGETFTTLYNYNNICQLVDATDVNGLTTNYTYDPRRRLWSEISPGGLQVLAYDYEMSPLSISTITSFPLDQTGIPSQGVTQNMDGWGNVLSVVRTDGAIMSSSIYDNMFRPTTQTQLGSGATEIIYEPSPLGRVQQTTDAVGNTTSINYLGGNSGHPELFSFTGTEIEDPNGHKSYSWTDAFGKGVLSISGEGGKTKTMYDPKGRPSMISNPIGETYNYDYNSMGLLAIKTIPQKGPEEYWYDKSMRMVAKSDANGNTLIMDYDDLYRLTKVGRSATGFVNPMTTVKEEEEVNSSITDELLLNFYVEDKTWMESTTEGILTSGGVNGTKQTVFTHDDYGRTETTNVVYSNGNNIFEDYLPINDAGISLNVHKDVTGPDGDTQNFEYIFGLDNLLRTTSTSLNYESQISLLENLVYNPLDQLEQKRIGGTSGGFLQNVDYTYDLAGKLLTINTPTENACIEEREVCQLYWGNVESNVALEEFDCGEFQGIQLDGVEYLMQAPVPMSETTAIEAFINAKIIENGFVGTAEVFYRNYLDSDIDFHISIMGTDIPTIPAAELIFRNCSFELALKDCCEILVVGQDGNFPIPGTPANPDLFFEKLTYDGLDISLIEMIGNCSAGLMRNHYDYDADHRLKEVKSDLYNPYLVPDAFSSTYSYDLAGNIQSITRNGWDFDTENFLEIDKLDFNYVPINTSELKTVNDESAQIEGFGKLNQLSTYDYDDNGNLIQDLGKQISSIDYNLLNSPNRVVHQTDGEMTYDYTFGGEKLKKNSPVEVREYVGGIEYKDAVLELIHIPNGRIVRIDDEMRFQYYLTDHLGNTVVVFEDRNGDGAISIEEETAGVDDEVLQRNMYYSFGMEMEGPWELNVSAPENKYLYNGKEMQSDFGLDWLDYGARMYDASVGRWNAVDPLAESYSSWSPYNYVMGNPISFIDPDGRSVESTHTDANGNVLAVYDDGDNSVYRHNNIESPETWYGNLLNVNMNQKDVTKMGETPIWDSFYSHEEGRSYGTIDFGSNAAANEIATFENEIGQIHNNNDQATTIQLYMINAGTGEFFDYKTEGAVEGISYQNLLHHRYRGSKLSGNLILSARDVGNFEAGMVAGLMGLPKMPALKMMGAFNANGNKLNGSILKQLTQNWSSPYGETPNSNSMQSIGYDYGVKRQHLFYKNYGHGN